MDLNHQYAAQQCALIGAKRPASGQERLAQIDGAAGIAGRIGAFPHGMGAAAACAWSLAQFADPAKP